MEHADHDASGALGQSQLDGVVDILGDVAVVPIDLDEPHTPMVVGADLPMGAQGGPRGPVRLSPDALERDSRSGVVLLGP